MRPFLLLLLLGLALKSLPQVVKAEYFFDDAVAAYGQATSLTVPPNTGEAQIVAELPLTGLEPGFHQVYFRVKDAVKGWSATTPKAFLKLNPHEVIVGFSYCIDAQADASAWIYKAFPSPATDVSMDVDFPLNGLSPGFHQVFFQAKDIAGERSPLTPKAFLRPVPFDTIVGFRYCIDDYTGSETWTYTAFPEPSFDVSMDVGLELGTLSKGIHYFYAAANSKNGIWTPISRGTFFNLYTEPLNITALEYYFEDENGDVSSLLTTNDFSASPNVTLDSVTFSIPATSLVDLKKYFINIRAVDEAGNKSFYLKDTLVYHVYTGIKDKINISRDLIVFPNPVSDLVNLKLVQLNYPGDFNIRIFDQVGRKLAEEEFSFRMNDHYSFDVSGMSSGIYTISICTTNGKMVARTKFVKK